MNGFRIIWPYYENPGQLKNQIGILNEYSENAQSKICLTVVDDGSPRNPALPVIKANPCKIKINLYRVKENIPWHQHGARNLGAKEAKDEWLFFTDIDHLLMPDQADKLLAKKLNPKCYYSFERVSLPELLPYKYHCNTFLVRREVFWKVGGYDEDFATGMYGGDGPFQKLMELIVSRVHCEDIYIVRVPREVQPDASTTDWPRTGAMKERYIKLLEQKIRLRNIKPKNPIRFHWERQL